MYSLWELKTHLDININTTGFIASFWVSYKEYFERQCGKGRRLEKASNVARPLEFKDEWKPIKREKRASDIKRYIWYQG